MAEPCRGRRQRVPADRSSAPLPAWPQRYAEAVRTFEELLRLDGAHPDAAAQLQACRALLQVSPGPAVLLLAPAPPRGADPSPLRSRAVPTQLMAPGASPCCPCWKMGSCPCPVRGSAPAAVLPRGWCWGSPGCGGGGWERGLQGLGWPPAFSVLSPGCLSPEEWVNGSCSDTDMSGFVTVVKSRSHSKSQARATAAASTKQQQQQQLPPHHPAR